MYRVTYYSQPLESYVKAKDFKTWEEAIQFANGLPSDTLLEMKQYEDSINNGSTLRSKE